MSILVASGEASTSDRRFEDLDYIPSDNEEDWFENDFPSLLDAHHDDSDKENNEPRRTTLQVRSYFDSYDVITLM